MKRFCLVTLALLLLLTACSGVSPEVPSDSPTPSVAMETSPVQTSAPTPDPSPEVSPSPDPEAIIREQFEQESEGKVLLTEEELLWFETEFFNLDDRISNLFLIGEYETPEQIDPVHVFSNSMGGHDVSDDELAALYDAYIERGYDGDWVYMADTKRTTSEEANATLQKYTGLTLAETEKGSFGVYLEQYDSYYTARTDTDLFGVKVDSGRWNDDGSVTLLYHDSMYEGSFFVLLKYSTVTLMPTEDGYWFVSNRRLDVEKFK